MQTKEPQPPAGSTGFEQYHKFNLKENKFPLRINDGKHQKYFTRNSYYWLKHILLLLEKTQLDDCFYIHHTLMQFYDYFAQC